MGFIKSKKAKTTIIVVSVFILLAIPPVFLTMMMNSLSKQSDQITHVYKQYDSDDEIDTKKFEELANDKRYNHYFVTWTLYMLGAEKESNPSTTPKEILVEAADTLRGHDLYSLVRHKDERVNGMSEDRIKALKSIKTDVTPDDFQFDFNEPFKEAWNDCRNMFDERYSGYLSEYIKAIDMAFPSTAPSCPELKDKIE